MLRRVTFTSFGNTNFDATTPLSVTFIMTQCAPLTKEIGRYKITARMKININLENQTDW
jgi:hypothetical protein